MPALPDPLDRLLAPLRASVGSLPSLWVVGPCMAVAIGGVALLGNSAGLVVELVCLAIVLLYCALRPSDRLTVVGLAISPAVVGAVVGDGFDIPRWTVSLPVAAVALFALRAQDRDDRAARASRPG